MVLAAVTQLTSTPSILHNLALTTSLLKRCAQAGARVVFFPEATDFISANASAASHLTYSSQNRTFVKEVKKCAKRLGVWVSIGVHEGEPGEHREPGERSKPEGCEEAEAEAEGREHDGGGHTNKDTKAESETGPQGIRRFWNTQLVIDDQGLLVAKYRKMHLFDVDIKGGLRIKESDSTVPGDMIYPPVESPIGKLGLLTCYDVRFPEASLSLRRRGAEIITYPSAFTVRTGLAHWQPLLQARAIETQSYVVAAAQSGQHPDTNRTSFGRGMIVDPWGVVVAQCSDASSTKETFALAEIDLDVLKSIRTEMPLWDQRRYDLYPEL